MDGGKSAENANARRGYAKVCFILGWVLVGWCVFAVAGTYRTWWPLVSSIFDGVVTGEAAGAALEMLGYAFGFAAGLCAVDGTRPHATAMFKPQSRAVAAACFAWVGTLCLPASGIVHVSYCLSCTSPFTPFSPGMWTHFIVMLICGAAFTMLAVLRCKENRGE